MSKRHIATVVLSIGFVGFGLATATSGTGSDAGRRSYPRRGFA